MGVVFVLFPSRMEVISRSFKFFKSARKIPKFIRLCHTKSNGLSYIHNSGKQPLVYSTIGQELNRVASEFGDHEAYVCVEENKKFTYDQLKIKADRLAAGFRAIGLTRGDRIGIWAPNVAMWPVVAFAAARAGLILVTLNPAYEPPEMEFVMKKVGIKTLVTSESFRSTEYYEKLLQIVPELDSSSTSGKIQSKKLPLLSSIVIDSEKYFP